MMAEPLTYKELAEQLLDIGQEFVLSDDVVSTIHNLGSKSVQILTKSSTRSDGIDPVSGLIKIIDQQMADYTIVFLDKISTNFDPNVSHFDRHDSPLGQVRTHLSYPYRIALDEHTGTIQVHDPRSGVVVIWCTNVNQYPYWAAATPFRLALAWIADTFDGEMLHGAVIEHDGSSLVLAGRSGAGKSTLTFLAEENGFRILTDDYFLFQNGLIYPVYSRGKLHDSSINLLANKNRRILNPGVENQKRIIQFDNENLRSFSNGIPIDKFLVPASSEILGVKVISSGEVFRNLAPYSASGLLGGLERSFLRTKRAISDKTAFSMTLKRPAQELIQNIESIFSHG